jgi:hypothetical protein
MGVLDDVIQLKNQGANDNEIVQTLSNQGVPPKQIYDALNQSKIKNAINRTMEENMQPSITDQGNVPIQQLEQGYNQQDYSNSNAQGGYDQIPQQGQYQEMYPQSGYDPNSGGDSNLMIELAEQVFSEKIKKIQKQMDELNELKTVMQVKVDNLSDSVKRMESIMDKLQISILDKVGSYGQNLDSIKKQMEMMQDSFSKTLPSLVKKGK